MAAGINSQSGRRPTEPPRRSSLVDVAKTAAEDLLDLLGSQIRLARVELAADARGAVQRATRLTIFLPPLVVGYAFAMAAAATWLAPRWGLPLSLAVLAAAQMLFAAGGIFLVIRGTKRLELLSRTSAEGSATAAVAVTALSSGRESANV